MAKAIWGIDFGNWSLKVVRALYDKKSDTLTVNLYDEFVYGELPCGFEASPLEKHREGIIAFQKKYEIAERRRPLRRRHRQRSLQPLHQPAPRLREPRPDHPLRGAPADPVRH